MLSRPASVALVAALRGGAPGAGVSEPLRARAADGDVAAASALADAVEAARGHGAAKAALAREQVRVPLADGSSLSLDEAERLLAAREQHGPHRELRRGLEQAHDEFRWFDEFGTDDATLGATVDAFLARSEDLAVGALEALEALGGAAVDDAPSLAWALDLPAPGFEQSVAFGVLDVARSAAGVALPCVRVPRALTGVVLDLEQVRLGVARAGLGADRWWRMLAGGLEVLVVGHAGDARLASAFALGAAAPVVLRRAGVARQGAERLCRIATARALLLLRGRAALAVHGWPDALEAVTRRSIRPTAALRELVAGAPVGGTGAAIMALVESAARAITLRDAWDEAFVLDPQAWQAGCPAPAGLAADAWRRWLEPWL